MPGALSLWVAAASPHGGVSVRQFCLNFLCVPLLLLPSCPVFFFFFLQITSWQVKREIGFLKVVETSPEAPTVAGSRRVSDSQRQGELRFDVQKDFLSGSLGRVGAGGRGWVCRLRSGCWGREGVSPGTSRCGWGWPSTGFHAPSVLTGELGSFLCPVLSPIHPESRRFRSMKGFHGSERKQFEAVDSGRAL